METPRYPIGIQSFEEIRSGGYIYVDKTVFVHRLAKAGKYYFLSRPRRFGKSLFLSTMEAYYLGRRDLFEGLDLDRLADNWDCHPVLHLDLNTGEYTDPEGLAMVLGNHLERWEKLYGVDSISKAPALRFGNIIRKAYEVTGKKVVILVDEYDKPLLNAIDNATLADSYRTTLKAFYGNLKTMDQYIKIAMISGVARFSKVSIFSDLNNLRDISFEEEYSEICGITERELSEYFKEGIRNLADRYHLSTDNACHKLRLNYDGYHFAQHSPGIYNPFSLVNSFAKNALDSYWFESGTPTYLVKLLKKGDFRLDTIDHYRIDKLELVTSGIMTGDAIPSLYQSGYLTIKDYDEEFEQYILGYPNEEVKQGFIKFLFPYYLSDGKNSSGFEIRKFVMAIREGRVDDFMKMLDSLIAKVPYSEKGAAPESHFQNAIYLIFTLMGFYARMEERISNGRIDLLVETDKYIYILEFKINSTAEAAMQQIQDKGYWRPYQSSGKEIILIGANFNTSDRRLDGSLIEMHP